MALSGGLMTLSAILMILCDRVSVGGIFLAAASCMFLSAYHFRKAENKKEKAEKSEDEKDTL